MSSQAHLLPEIIAQAVRSLSDGRVQLLQELFALRADLTQELFEAGKSPISVPLSQYGWRLDQADQTLDPRTIAVGQARRIQATDKLATAIIHEACEVRDWTPWKAWRAKDEVTVNDAIAMRAEIIIELADLLHFVLALAEVWGVDARLLYSAYVVKHKENIRRARMGY